ncbi:hypothetical protein LWI28_000970 [Acer negundo]|uniref:Uncharacterized protein n=1 Tax=Acer negundo TaxID=4023 RepID=A0AAD5NGG7_ACENE|nr:hypothetical protein LWI28_000970 [Acer negundo]
MPTFLEKAMHQNLYNVHGTASNSTNIKDKTEEVDNKDSESTKPDGHPPKVNECADKNTNLRKLIIRTPRPQYRMNMLLKSMNLKLQLRVPYRLQKYDRSRILQSPVPNLMVPIAEQSLIILENQTHNCPERDLETMRKRKREKFLNSLWIDPEKRKKRKRVKPRQLHDISNDDDLLDPKYDVFLKTTGNDIS